MEKSKYFERELGYIKSDRIRNNAKVMIEKLPDYFFEIAAASTGKYHPRYAQGEGGLLRHTKAAVRLAKELLANPIFSEKYTSDEQDIMIMALILHDGLKLGKERSRYTKFDHPLLMAEFIMENKNELDFSEEELKLLTSVIKTHMGPWTKDYEGKEVLSAPKTKYENFVHMCDYLASRKCLIFEFTDNNEVIG